MQFILPVAISVLLLSFLIVFHEYGHYLVARLCGVGIREFSIGFGPAFWQKKRGPTTFALRLLPFGGYVRMKGLEEEEPSSDPDSFTSKRAWQRMLIIAAGPLMNLLLGFVLFYVEAAAVGIPRTMAVVSEVISGSPAARAGIAKGDVLLTVNGHPFDSPERVDFSNPQGVQLTLQGLDGGIKDASVFPETVNYGQITKKGIGVIFQFYYRPTGRVGQVLPDAPASAAGVRPGDEILTINGMSLAEFIRHRSIESRKADAKPQPLTLEWKRDGRVFKRTVTGSPDDLAGLRPQADRSRLGPVGSARQAYDRLASALDDFKVFFTKLVRHPSSVSGEIAGPVGIFKITYNTLQSGYELLLELMAILSITLGIMNLIPFPPLDGSRLAFLGYEVISTRPVNRAKENLIHLVGAILLVTLLIWITIRDIAR